MAQQNGDSPGEDSGSWDGYSDYRTVSSRIGRSVDDAIDAYAVVRARHDEGARIRPPVASESRARILGAAMRLIPEMQSEAQDGNRYDKILSRWLDRETMDDDSFEGSVPEGGYIRGFAAIQLTDEAPDWLYDFVLDIRRAGWELGYLKAGRREEVDDEDFEENDVLGMM